MNNKPWLIRDERPADEPHIREVVRQAFDGMPYADGDEPELVYELRTQGALSVSLVACIDQQIVGHISFSPAPCDDGSCWFALAPVSVLPQYQGQGVGAALIHEGLERIVSMQAQGCILTGNPDYYRRFGFDLAPDHVPAGQPPEYFMLKPLLAAAPSAPLSFHPAFDSLSHD